MDFKHGVKTMFGGKTIRTKKGKEVTLLNPAAKGRKYATELGQDIKYTNDGNVKVDSNGAAFGLSPLEKSYRAGYLDARRDSAKAHKYN